MTKLWNGRAKTIPLRTDRPEFRFEEVKGLAGVLVAKDESGNTHVALVTKNSPLRRLKTRQLRAAIRSSSTVSQRRPKMKNGSKPMRVTSFMLPNEMIDRLGKDAAAHGVSKSALLRRLLVVAYRHPTEIGEPTVTHTREYIS